MHADMGICPQHRKNEGMQSTSFSTMLTTQMSPLVKPDFSFGPLAHVRTGGPSRLRIDLRIDRAFVLRPCSRPLFCRFVVQVPISQRLNKRRPLQYIRHVTIQLLGRSYMKLQYYSSHRVHFPAFHLKDVRNVGGLSSPS